MRTEKPFVHAIVWMSEANTATRECGGSDCVLQAEVELISLHFATPRLPFFAQREVAPSLWSISCTWSQQIPELWGKLQFTSLYFGLAVQTRLLSAHSFTSLFVYARRWRPLWSKFLTALFFSFTTFFLAGDNFPYLFTFKHSRVSGGQLIVS